MEKNIAEKVFDGVYKVYDKFLAFATLRRIDRWQRELIDSTPLGRFVLDVGTGTGEVLKKLLERGEGFKLIGLDVSLKMLKVAKGKLFGRKGVLLIRSDALRIPIKDGTLDNLFFSLVFRHLPYDKSIPEVKRVLREGGYVSILEIGKPESDFLYTLIHLFMDKIFGPFGRLIFSKEEWDYFVESVENAKRERELVELFSKSGFRVYSYSKRFFGLIHIAIFKKEAL